MKGRRFTGVIALGVMVAATVVFSQTKPATEGPAVGETPAWFLQGSFPDPTGRTIVEPGGKVTVPARAGGAGGRGGAARGAGPATARGTGAAAPAIGPDGEVIPPGCRQSPLCGRRGGTPRQSMQRVQWKQTLGYTFSIHMYCRPDSAACPRSRSIRRATSGCFSARTSASRSSSNSIRTTSSSSRSHPTSSAIRTRRTGWRSTPRTTSG